MDVATQLQILDTNSANIFGKSMNPTISLQLCVNSRADWIFNLGMAIGWGKEKSVRLCLKLTLCHIPLVSEGLDKYMYIHTHTHTHIYIYIYIYI